MHIDLELAPTHIGDQRLSPFERHLMVALHEMREQMSEQHTATQTAIAALEAADANLAAAFTSLSTEVAALVTTVTNEPTAIADAVKAAIASAGGDPNDAVNAAAIQAAADADAKLTASVTDLATKASAAEAAATAPAPAPTPTPPTPDPAPQPPPPVTVSNVSVTGTAGTPVSGQLTATGGEAPYAFALVGTPVGDFTVTPDGFYAMNPTAAVTGSMQYTATDAAGDVSEPGSISVSITAAA